MVPWNFTWEEAAGSPPESQLHRESRAKVGNFFYFNQRKEDFQPRQIILGLLFPTL